MFQIAFEGGFRHMMSFAFLFEMSQNRTLEFLVLWLFQVTCFLFEMPHFHVRGIQNFQFTPFQNPKGKWGITNKNHVTNFQTVNGPKIQFFDFEAFQIKMQMPSHVKVQDLL